MSTTRRWGVSWYGGKVRVTIESKDGELAGIWLTPDEAGEFAATIKEIADAQRRGSTE